MSWKLPLVPLGSLLGIAASLLGSAALGAQPVEVAVVGVHLDELDDAAATQASAGIVDALAKTGRLVPVSPADVSARIAGREQLVLDDAILGPGKLALDEGRILYERAEFDDAIDTLGQAVALLTEAMPAMTDNRLLIDALLMQGLTHFSIGDNGPAQAAFERVVLLDPSRRLDPVNYSGPTVEFFDMAQAAVSARGVGSIAVEGEGGSSVFVDGQRRGETPLRVDDLPAGDHAVLVVGAAGQRAFSQAQVDAGQVTSLRPALARGLFASAAVDDPGRARQTGQLYRALGTYADTDLVLLSGQLSDGSVAVQLYQPRTGNFSTVLNLSPADPVQGIEEAVGSLADLLDDSGGLRTDAVYPRAAPLDISANAMLLSMLLDPEPIVTEVFVPTPGMTEDDGGGVPWFVWAGVGAVAAGGATTAAVLLSTGGGGSGDSGTIIVGPMP